jgi:hypothetical protein
MTPRPAFSKSERLRVTTTRSWVRAGAAIGQAFAQKPPATSTDEIEPKAIDALKASGAYLTTLKSFTVRADTTTDEVLRIGQNIQFFYWGTDKSGIEDIKSAISIGPSRVGGVECDHYADRQEGVDWQAWIGSNEGRVHCRASS